MSGKTAKLARQKQRSSDRAAFEGVVFWHGGAPGLTVGETVLPLSQIKSGSLLSLLPAGYGANPSRADRVYVTSDREFARAYAARFSIKFPGANGAGALYRVEPRAPFEVDLDYDHVRPRMSVQCGSALVTGVEESPVVMSTSDASAAAMKYATWNTGEPMYDRNGAVNPDPGMQRFGLTTADTSAIWAPWTPFSITWAADVQAYIRRRK